MCVQNVVTQNHRIAHKKKLVNILRIRDYTLRYHELLKITLPTNLTKSNGIF